MNITRIIFTFFLYLYFSLYETFLLLYNCNYNEKLNATIFKPQNHTTILRDITRIHYNDLHKNTLSKYIDKSEPVILIGMPEFYLKEITKIHSKEILTIDKLVLNTYIFPNLKKLSTFINNYINKKILILIHFSGKYKQGLAHLDSGSSYNFYFLKKGKKQVYIIPQEYTKYLDLQYGEDNVFVKDDKLNLLWINKLPEYYNFILNENEILIFNNVKTIHKFKNLNGDEEAYSVRLSNMDANGLVLKKNIFNYELMTKFFDNLTKSNIIREPLREFHDNNFKINSCLT